MQCDGAWQLTDILVIVLLPPVGVGVGLLARRCPLLVRKFALLLDGAKLRVCWATYQILGSIRWAMDESQTYPSPFREFEQVVSSVTQLSLSQVGRFLSSGCVCRMRLIALHPTCADRSGRLFGDIQFSHTVSPRVLAAR